MRLYGCEKCVTKCWLSVTGRPIVLWNRPLRVFVCPVRKIRAKFKEIKLPEIYKKMPRARCDFCDKTFITFLHLTKHIMLHEKDLDFENCVVSFTIFYDG